MAKIMEQPIVDFLRQQLNFSGFPLPSVSEDENHLIVYEQDSYKQNSELLELFQHLQSVMRILIFYGQTMLNMASLNLLSSTPIIIWLLLLNVSLKLQIIVAKNCEEGNLVRDWKAISRYSVEGALHYAKYLFVNYDVIAIAVSGTPDNYRINTFAWEKGRLHIEDEKGPFVNLNIHSILSYKEYTQAFDSINTIKRTILEKDALSVPRFESNSL